MFAVSVEGTFSAVHRLRLDDGTVEPMHGHDWAVRAWFAAAGLDSSGMVIDFHQAQAVLRGVMEQLHHTDLNTNPALAGINPTAEAVARFLLEQIRARGLAQIRRVEVTEAPGCTAAFEANG